MKNKARFVIAIINIMFFVPSIVMAQAANTQEELKQIKEQLKQLQDQNEKFLEENKLLQKRVEQLEKIEMKTTSATPALSTPSEPGSIEKTAGNATVDLAVPESPAFAVLGLSPQNVIRPTSPRALATELLNGIDQNGNFQSGVAIDTAPLLLFNGKNITLEKYQTSYTTRLFTNTQLSFATAKGSNDDDKSIRLATGLRITPWDKGDPRMYGLKYEDGKKIEPSWLERCFDDAVNDPTLMMIDNNIIIEIPKKIIKAINNEDECVKKGEPNCERFDQIIAELVKEKDQLVADYEAKLIPLAEKCRNDLRPLIWNRSSWTIGVAPTWISTSGDTRDLGWDGVGVWTSLAYGFEGVPTLEEKSQFIVHARYRTDEEEPVEGMEGTFLTQDSLFIGARLLIAPVTPLFVVELEGGYTYQDPEDRDTENSYVFSVAANARIVDNLWLEVSFGGRSKDSSGDGQAFVLSSLKWGFQSAPTLGQQEN